MVNISLAIIVISMPAKYNITLPETMVNAKGIPEMPSPPSSSRLAHHRGRRRERVCPAATSLRKKGCSNAENADRQQLAQVFFHLAHQQPHHHHYTALTPPPPGYSAWPNRLICARAGLERIPATAKKPQNTRAALTPTRIFIMAKTALPNIARKPSRFR